VPRPPATPLEGRRTLALVSLASLLVPASALGATWTVNSTADTNDGTCDADCTLREAMSAVNDNDDIVFSFSSASSPQTITLGSALPSLTAENVTIDGFSCTNCGTVTANTNTPDQGFNSSLGLELVAAYGTSTPVLRLVGSDSTVQGLVIRGGLGDGIRISGDGVTVTGCYIGTNAAGTAASANADNGVHVDDKIDATIGPYNLISGNTDDGIDVGGNSDGITIVGNLIGTDVTGLVDLGNGDEGIQIGGSAEIQDVTIGGSAAADRNVVSGNGEHGIFIKDHVDGSKGSGSIIEGNTVGLTADGLTALPNAGDGVRIDGSSVEKPKTFTIEDNLISGNTGVGLYLEATESHVIVGNFIGTNTLGGALGNGAEGIYMFSSADHDTKKMDIGDLSVGRTVTADQNEIAFNVGDGIRMRRGGGAKQTKENTVGANSIHDNGGLGVDLEKNSTGNGATLPGANANCNSSNDITYGNRGIGKPIVATAQLDGTTLTVTGNSCNNATVDLYLVDDPANANGQPETWLATATADGTGLYTLTATGPTVAPGDEVTVLQTDSELETSEAGDNLAVVVCDADGDGFNDINLTSCSSNTDCDDTDASTFPGATELCDGVDNDCDGLVPANETDTDFDTFLDCNDCGPNNNTIFPGATEVCDGVDQDCDTSIDEDFDTDGDTFTTCGADGNPATTADNDCDDTDIAVFPGATEVCDAVDQDCDTLVDEDFDTDGDTFTTCGADGNPATTADNDCDDTVVTIFPGATEVCDAIDQDCDGLLDEDFDTDGDTFTTCGADGNAATTADNDCDDTTATTFPGATEACDGEDQDCDTLVDEDFDTDGDTFTTCGADGNAATTADNDCDDTAVTIFPGATEVCDAIDQDCDGLLDEDFDTDGDTFTTCGADGNAATTADNDCDDTAVTVFPGATEVCNAVDEDCDGTVDEGFDTDGDTFTTCGADGSAATTADNDCDDTVVTIFPGATEVCDAIDQDCDGLLDEDFDVDGDTWTTCGADGDASATADNDCDDAVAAVNPGATELCNGIDDDCDGLIDENADLDNDGVTNCDGDCDDNNNTVFPNAPELCDGLDNDCDGAVPVDEQDLDNDLALACDDDCDDNVATVYTGAVEVCDGLDNDCDGGVPGDELDGDGDGQSRCEGDCDDTDDTIFLGAPEVCSDGIDQDCDGVDADDLDVDEDGWSACDGDCDDADPAVNPDAEELCDDGIDNDCDGRLLDSSDADGDGVSACGGDCDDDDPDVFPGNPELCNDLDEDCDDLVDEDAPDLDGDGYDACEDCDDERDDVFPEGDELCDGLDGDCDGVVPDDEADADGDGVRPCGGDCDDTEPTALPGGEEVCGDGIDQDCEDGDLLCGGTITLGTPAEETGCRTSVAGAPGGAGWAMVLGLGVFGLRRRRSGVAIASVLAVATVLGGCTFDSTLRVQTWWGAADSTEDLFFEAGGGFDAVGLSSSFQSGGATWTELTLVGGPEGVDCATYAAFRGAAAGAMSELAAELADPAARTGTAENVGGLLCQRVEGAAREAFGWEGTFQALHVLARTERPPPDGHLMPAEGGALPADGFYVGRYVERGGLGAGLVPDGDGAEAPYDACVSRVMEAFRATDAGELDTTSSGEVAAWALAGRRGEHHDPAREEVAHEAGGTSPVGLVLPNWSGPSEPGDAVDVTGFVTLADAPEGVAFERAALGTSDPGALEACPALAGSESFVWPEAASLPEGGDR